MRMTGNNKAAAALDCKAEEPNSGMENGEILMCDELLTSTHKFLEVLNSTIQQLQIQGIPHSPLKLYIWFFFSHLYLSDLQQFDA